MHELNSKGFECNLLSSWVYRGDNPDMISLPAESAHKYVKMKRNLMDSLMGHMFYDGYLKRAIATIVKEGHYDWIVNHTYDLSAAIPQIEGVKTAQIFNWSIPGYEATVSCNIRCNGLLRAALPMFGFSVLKQRWHTSLSHFDKLVMLTDATHKEVECYKDSRNEL